MKICLKKEANMQTFLRALEVNTNQHIKSCSLSGSHFNNETIKALVTA